MFMQFQVPQFIETEDKIVGPLTLRQFIYVAVAGIIVFTLFFVLELWLWFIIALILGSVSAMFAFLKVNGRPMRVFVQSAFNFIWSPRIYTLKPKEEKPEEVQMPKLKKGDKLPVFGGIRNLLDKMTTSKTAVPKREKTIAEQDFGIPQKKIIERYEIIKRATGEKEIARRVDYR